MKTLGILVTSERHAPWALRLACSACRQGVRVHIHLTGSAGRIAARPELAALLEVADVTVCRGSADRYLRPGERASCDPRLFVPAAKRIDVIGCDRHVIL